MWVICGGKLSKTVGWLQAVERLECSDWVYICTYSVGDEGQMKKDGLDRYVACQFLWTWAHSLTESGDFLFTSLTAARPWASMCPGGSVLGLYFHQWVMFRSWFSLLRLASVMCLGYSSYPKHRLGCLVHEMAFSPLFLLCSQGLEVSLEPQWACLVLADFYLLSWEREERCRKRERET